MTRASAMVERLSLSPVTIGSTDFVQSCEIAAGAGFTGIAIRYDQLERFLQNRRSTRDAVRILNRLGLTPTEMGFLAEWQFYGGVPLVSKRTRSGEVATERELLERLQIFCERCVALGVRHVTAAATHDVAGTIGAAAQDFARLAAVGAEYGLEMSFEFFGNAKCISTLRDAVAMVSAAGADNGGIVLDTFFFYQGGSRLEDIRALAQGGVPLHTVQLADSIIGEPATLDILFDRRLPGTGIVPLRDIVEAVESTGYHGWYTVEVFHAPTAPPDAAMLARLAKSTASSLFEQIAA
jgi:2-keto-myo-inositol isomerase